MDIQIPDFETELSWLLEAIYQKYKYDFRDYSPASMKRRMSQAMRELQCATLTGRIYQKNGSYPVKVKTL